MGSFERFTLFIFVCVLVCLNVCHVWVGAGRSRKRREDPRELLLQVVLKCASWVLSPRQRSWLSACCIRELEFDPHNTHIKSHCA